MKKRRKAYDEIRKQYPETISKDQFYRIAHISKATALYLLQSGLVPCIDSGKKTRRYTIRTDSSGGLSCTGDVVCKTIRSHETS